LAILDDGLQHHCLSRDVELVLMTSARPWQRVFREFPGFLRAPVLAAWTKGGSEPWGWRRFQERIRVTWGQRAPEEATGLWLVTGVAQGQQVRRSLEAAGWRVDLHHDFKDHAGFERDQVRDILEKAGSAGLKVALTGKDWVKWRALGVRRAEVEVFEPEMILDEQGRRAWSRVLWGS
jgi:tetraacyldisaccharide-1-P 4'-kinase